MPKILLINTNCSFNKGSAAQVISTYKTLSRLIPNANFTLISGSREPDSKGCVAYNIKVVAAFNEKNPFATNYRLVLLFRLFELFYYVCRCSLWLVLTRIGLNAETLLNNDILREYCESDLILDLSGDAFSDKGSHSFFSIFADLIGVFLNKKIVVYSQSIGPFSKMMMPLARFTLNKANLIVVREDITRNYLKGIGISNPSIYVNAEIAFLLEPAPLEKVREIITKEGLCNTKGPLIGICARLGIDRIFKSNQYVVLMAQITDYLIEKLHAKVVFIPHVVIPPQWNRYGSDDRSIAEKIYHLVQNKRQIRLIKNDYSPEEMKGIIGQCDLFIGARMHSNIASLSMHVPTIAIAWSHKYRGIMRMLELEKYICHIETLTFSNLVSKINDAWSNRDKIRAKIESKIKILEKSAFQSGELIKALLESG